MEGPPATQKVPSLLYSTGGFVRTGGRMLRSGLGDRGTERLNFEKLESSPNSTAHQTSLSLIPRAFLHAIRHRSRVIYTRTSQSEQPPFLPFFSLGAKEPHE